MLAFALVFRHQLLQTKALTDTDMDILWFVFLFCPFP